MCFIFKFNKLTSLVIGPWSVHGISLLLRLILFCNLCFEAILEWIIELIKALILVEAIIIINTRFYSFNWFIRLNLLLTNKRATSFFIEYLKVLLFPLFFIKEHFCEALDINSRRLLRVSVWLRINRYVSVRSICIICV